MTGSMQTSGPVVALEGTEYYCIAGSLVAPQVHDYRYSGQKWTTFREVNHLQNLWVCSLRLTPVHHP